MLYSIVGLVLPAVCRLKTRTLLVVAAVCMAQPVEWIKALYAAFVDGSAQFLVFDCGEYWDASMKMLSEGGFIDTVKTNLWEGQLFSLAWAWGAGRFFQTASSSDSWQDACNGLPTQPTTAVYGRVPLPWLSPCSSLSTD